MAAGNATVILAAEQMLGRQLTSAEILWARYTHGMPDYYLYCLTILLLAVFYTLASIPYLVLDHLRLPFFEKYRLQPNSRTPPAEVWRCYVSVMRTMLTVILPLQLLSYPFFKIAGITGQLPLPPLSHMCLQLLVFFMVEDYGNYWIHRLFHTPWLFEKVHYMHHEFSTPVGVASTYAHWAEVLVLGVPSFVGPAIVRCHVVTLWAWIVLRQMEAIETHSGYHFPWNPLRLIPFYGGADFHDYHHEVGGKSQGNFASVFTYCDWLYGTDKGYRLKRRVQRQLKEEAMRKGLKGD